MQPHQHGRHIQKLAPWMMDHVSIENTHRVCASMLWKKKVIGSSVIVVYTNCNNMKMDTLPRRDLALFAQLPIMPPDASM
jgi:hypothetical protein